MILVYVTTSSVREAEKIGKKLVQEQLAACVNILPKMHSIYRWKGKIESANETVLIIKTRNANFSKVEKRVKQLHSYEVPCILQIKIPQGSRDYLSWISKETR